MPTTDWSSGSKSRLEISPVRRRTRAGRLPTIDQINKGKQASIPARAAERRPRLDQDQHRPPAKPVPWQAQ